MTKGRTRTRVQATGEEVILLGQLLVEIPVTATYCENRGSTSTGGAEIAQNRRRRLIPVVGAPTIVELHRQSGEIAARHHRGKRRVNLTTAGL